MVNIPFLHVFLKAMPEALFHRYRILAVLQPLALVTIASNCLNLNKLYNIEQNYRRKSRNTYIHPNVQKTPFALVRKRHYEPAGSVFT